MVGTEPLSSIFLPSSVTMVTLSRDSSFYLQALRLRLLALSSRRFSSAEGGDSDFLQLPASISTNTPESQVGYLCIQVSLQVLNLSPKNTYSREGG